jgi:hypothetical protein
MKIPHQAGAEAIILIVLLPHLSHGCICNMQTSSALAYYSRCWIAVGYSESSSKVSVLQLSVHV